MRCGRIGFGPNDGRGQTVAAFCDRSLVRTCFDQPVTVGVGLSTRAIATDAILAGGRSEPKAHDLGISAESQRCRRPAGGGVDGRAGGLGGSARGAS